MQGKRIRVIHVLVLLALALLAASPAGAQLNVYTDRLEFLARNESVSSNFSGRVGTEFPNNWIPGALGYGIAGPDGITIDGVQYVGNTWGWFLETYLIEPVGIGATAAFNGQTTLFGGRYGLTINLPPGTTAYGMELSQGSLDPPQITAEVTLSNGSTTSLVVPRPGGASTFLGFSSSSGLQNIQFYTGSAGTTHFIRLNDVLIASSSVAPPGLGNYGLAGVRVMDVQCDPLYDVLSTIPYGWRLWITFRVRNRDSVPHWGKVTSAGLDLWPFLAMSANLVNAFLPITPSNPVYLPEVAPDGEVQVTVVRQFWGSPFPLDPKEKYRFVVNGYFGGQPFRAVIPSIRVPAP